MQTPAAEELSEIVRQVVGHLSPECAIAVTAGEDNRTLAVSVSVPQEAKFLIGRNGQNLKALEHVIRAMWSRRSPGGPSVSVDVNDYRKAYLQQLVEQVHTTARRVRETKKSEAMDPMNPYERRVVHTELAVYHDIASESVGQDPHRRVVIKPL